MHHDLPQDLEAGLLERGFLTGRNWMLKFSLTKTGSAGENANLGRLAHRSGFRHVYLWVQEAI